MIETHTNNGYCIRIPESFHGYNVINFIGCGSTSSVCLVQNELTGELFSSKIIPKRYIRENQLLYQIKKEISIMKTIDHPNIVKFIESFELKTIYNEIYIIIIMEYCENGDLCSYINERGFENEEQKAKIIHDLLKSIQYLHNRCIAHGDIKLENILLDSEFNAKLTDFGYCKTKKIMGDYSKSGTLYYAAPELLVHGKYNTLKADIWSIGILLYCIQLKNFPFRRGSDQYIVDQIVSNNLNFESDLSDDYRSVIEKCTLMDAEKRPTIHELLENECFSWNKKKIGESNQEKRELFANEITNLQKYSKSNSYCSLFCINSTK